MEYTVTEEASSEPLHRRRYNGGFYHELQLVNYTSEPLFLIDAHHTQVVIQPESKLVNPRGHVEIRTRSVVGPRKFKPGSCFEEWSGSLSRITIPRARLRSGPIYVKELDAVLCFEADLGQVVHPHFEGVYETYIHQVQQDIRDKLKTPPVTVIANDPTSTIDHLFLVLDGHLCRAEVDHNPLDLPHCFIGYRNQDSGDYDYVSLDMRKILAGECRHTVGDRVYLVSTDREVVQRQHNIDLLKQKAAGGNSEELELRMVQVRQQYDGQIQTLQHQVKSLQKEKECLVREHRCHVEGLETQVNRLNGLLAVQEAQETRLSKERLLSLEERRELRTSRQQLRLEEYRDRREQRDLAASETSFLGSVVKAAAVIVPAAVLLVRWASSAASSIGGLLSWFC